MTPGLARAEAEDLFVRHLDLVPLGNRRRGRVLCIFHRERTPSLSVDLDRGLFNCFGCGVHGGVAKFAELVGGPAPPRRPITTPRSTLALALNIARRQPWYREEIRLIYRISDAIRDRYRAVRVARHVATLAGDRPEAWRLLATAAEVERETGRIEKLVDDVMW